MIPQLNKHRIPEHELERCVYIVRSNGDFAIKYPKGNSPTLYIGQGIFKNRLTQHKNWLKPLSNLVGEIPFLIGVSTLRVRNNRDAYCDLEAALIQEFKSIYGLMPLMNKKIPTRLNDNYIYLPEKEFRGALMIGKGFRYYWTLEPMPSSSFYYDYYKASV